MNMGGQIVVDGGYTLGVADQAPTEERFECEFL